MKIKIQEVLRVFEEYPPQFRKKLELLRRLIIKTAKSLPEVGDLEETLKWGEPSYLPKKKNIGTTVRIHWLKSKPKQCGIYFNCQTNLIAKFKKKFPGVFKFEGKRAIIFCEDDVIPEEELRDCISIALTYHIQKRLRKSRS